MAQPLSVCIIAKNEELLLPHCLNSIRDLSSDVIVVVDSLSHDSTESLAKKFGAKVYSRIFDNFAAQKNFALTKAKHDWVFSIDADEQVSPELAQEIAQVLIHPDSSAYSIPRLNYIFQKPIYHTDWSPESDRHVWLFDKTKCTWVGDVHELVKVEGRIGRLHSPKVHNNYQTVEQFLDTIDLYTSLENRQVSILYPFWKFFRHYFLYLGFLDGWHGLFLSYLQSLYGWEVYVKSWQKKQH